MRRKILNSVFFIGSALLFLAFKSGKKGGGDFNVYHPDYDYLNELIIEKINAKRLNDKKPELQKQPALTSTALYFTRDMRLSRLQRLMGERKRLQKKVGLVSWQKGYNNNLLTVVVTTKIAVDFEGGSFYFDKSDQETANHLFYGEKPKKKEVESGEVVPLPVKDLSYEELADRIARDFLRERRSFKSMNAGYDLVGCSCSIEPSTLNRKRIPVIKAIFILGGRRINF